MGTEKYITGYACKGNQPTGAIADLFNDIVNCSDNSGNTTALSVCKKVLISTVKRDVSSVEASYEISSLPLNRSSHTFKTVSLSGSRIIEKDGQTITRNTALDNYLHRDKKNEMSFYEFICQGGKVPVISSASTTPSWPLPED